MTMSENENKSDDIINTGGANPGRGGNCLGRRGASLEPDSYMSPPLRTDDNGGPIIGL